MIVLGPVFTDDFFLIFQFVKLTSRFKLLIMAPKKRTKKKSSALKAAEAAARKAAEDAAASNSLPLEEVQALLASKQQGAVAAA